MADFRPLFGWQRDPEGTAAFVASLPAPTLAQAGPGLTLDRNLPVFLGHQLLRVMPGWTRFNQPIGSCCGWGASHVADVTAACDILIRKEREGWGGRTIEGVTYGFSRVEVNSNRPNYGGDGSSGWAVAQALTKFGTLQYGRDYNGTVYHPGKISGNQEREWGRNGIPEALQQIASSHKFDSCTKVTTFDEAATLIQNGYAVMVASDEGWDMTLDHGWCQGRDNWPHLMAFTGVVWDLKRGPGLYCQNSWGDCYRGTYDETLPVQFRRSGCYVPEARVNRMLRCWDGDSFSVAGFNGFKPGIMAGSWTGGLL